MKRIGITGGIASGKSAVTNYLRSKGYIVIDADEGARKVVEPGTEGLEKIKAVFGEGILLSNGILNRQILGEIIFSDELKRQQLNQIMHPLIFEWIEQEIKQLNTSIVFIDMPLLYEVGYQKRVDEVWLIYVSLDMQLERLMKRNQLNKLEAKKRIQAQWSLDKKCLLVDKVIDNNHTLETLYRQLDELLDNLNS